MPHIEKKKRENISNKKQQKKIVKFELFISMNQMILIS